MFLWLASAEQKVKLLQLCNSIFTTGIMMSKRFTENHYQKICTILEYREKLKKNPKLTLSEEYGSRMK